MLIGVVLFAILAVLLGIACCASSRRGRIIGAIVAFGWSCLIFMAANMAESFNLNIWYSSAADDLLETPLSRRLTRDRQIRSPQSFLPCGKSWKSHTSIVGTSTNSHWLLRSGYVPPPHQSTA
jgi:hypothetical protein